MDNNTLKLIRLFHGYTQEGYAELLGVNQSSIAKAELGYIPVTDRMRARVALHFDTQEPDFLEFKNRMATSKLEEKSPE